MPDTPPANHWMQDRWGEVARYLGKELSELAGENGRFVHSIPVIGERGLTAGYFLVFERDVTDS